MGWVERRVALGWFSFVSDVISEQSGWSFLAESPLLKAVQARANQRCDIILLRLLIG